jgi:hypothetical protein
MKLLSLVVLLWIFQAGCVNSTPRERATSRHVQAVIKANRKAAADAEQSGWEEL